MCTRDFTPICVQNTLPSKILYLRDESKLALLVRAKTVNSLVVDSIPPKTENSNIYGFELHRPSIKGTKLLFHVTKAIIIITHDDDYCFYYIKQ